jgi:RNA polymerase sigma-70 factor, ECF subfamily
VTTSQPPVEFLTLWTADARRVSAYIYSLVHNWSDADDLLQETSVVLLEKFDQFEPGTSFSAWACKVAYLKVLEFYKRRRPVEHLDEIFLEAVHHDAMQFSEGLDRRLEALADCLKELSDKDRKLIELRYRGECPIPVVAKKTSRTVTAVYKALERSQKTLLRCIRRKLAEGKEVLDEPAS